MQSNLNNNNNRSDIERLVMGYNEYETYWHIYNYRINDEKFKYLVSREPRFHKDILIELLENSGKNESGIKVFLKNTPRIMTPFQYVNWFYEDDRISLWLKIVCNRFTDSLPSISNKSDIRKFVHDLIYNANLVIRDSVVHFKAPVFQQKNLDSMESFKRLEKIYIDSKIDKRTVAFLRDSKNVDHAYNYIKDKVPTVLVLKYAQDISFESTSDKLNYVLAVLDYWNFEKLWGSNKLAQLNDEGDEQTREEFIKKVKDACNSKNSRDRAKKLKETGLELTKQNKKNLRYLAKSRGKTKHDVLNELVELAYNQTRNQEIQLNSSFPNQYAFFDEIPQTQSSSSQSESSEKTLISEENSRIEDKEGRSRQYTPDSEFSSPYSDEYAPSNTVTPIQNSNSLKPLYVEDSVVEQGVGQQSSADFNAQFIADKMAGRLR